jgi:proteasome lid subunit RPN8/RPN11
MPADHPKRPAVIAGPAGSDRPERFIPMVNAARSPTFYEFDSMDLLRLYREMDDNDEVPVVVYHSHTATEAYPSRTDITTPPSPRRTTSSSRLGRPAASDGPYELRSVPHRGRRRDRGADHRRLSGL